MQREFIVTRTLLVLGALALGLTIVLQGNQPIRQPGPGASLDTSSPQRPDAPSWEEELLQPDIQALWLERRLLLESLSQRYCGETDDARREALRREMEHIIEISERDVNELRLRNARRDSNEELVAWLEHAREQLPTESTDIKIGDRTTRP